METQILDIQGVMEITGLARQTIYAEIYKKTIPYAKFGPRLLRFKRDEILYWMEHRHESFRPMKDVLAERKAAVVTEQ
jgi:excisionase family DNA binding protein